MDLSQVLEDVCEEEEELKSPYYPPIVTLVATQTTLGDLGSFLQ